MKDPVIDLHLSSTYYTEDTCADCGHPIQGYSPIVVHTYTSKHADKPTSTRIICQSCDYFDDCEPYSIFG